MENIKEVLSNISLKRGIDTFLKGILTEEQEEDLKNKIRIFIADAKSDYKPSEEDVYKEAKGRGMYRYLNELKGGAAFNKGGMPMQMQMAFMEEGGLKDEGGEIDPESGNEVPSGSLKEEVRDDLPTMLSEGEFVFPADVVRYIGLEKLMMMRQEAKMGLKRMEAMGQMGNADEATIPDDLPFGMADLVVVAGGKDDEPQKMQTGGLSSNSPQFRTLESPQEVPVRSGRRNIQLPTIPNIGDEDEDDIEEEINDILDEEDDIAVEEEMANVDFSDKGFGQTDTADMTPKGFDAYKGTDFADAAMSFENVGSKLLSYTPLGALSNISYKTGAEVALEALKKGYWADTDLSLPNPFTDEEGEKRIGTKLSEWEKVALAKYLTVERPKNSIFESVSNWIGKAFGKEVKEEKKDEKFSKALLEQLNKIKGLSVDPKTGEVKYNGKDINEWLLENRPKPRKDIVEGNTNLSKQFETTGVINYKGHNLNYMGDVGGTGSSRMDIFRVTGTDGKVRFYRRYEIEKDIPTTGENATENVIEWLVNKSSEDAGNPPVFKEQKNAAIEAVNENNLSDPLEPTDDYNIGKMGEFDTSPVTGPIQDPSEIPTPSPTPDYANPTLGLDPYVEREGPPDTGNPFSRPIQSDPIVEIGDFNQTDAVDPYAPIPMATSGKIADYMEGIKPTVTDPTVTPFDEKDRVLKVGPELDLSGIPSLQTDPLDAFGGAGPDIDISDPLSSVNISIQEAKEAAKKAKEKDAEIEAQAAVFKPKVDIAPAPKSLSAAEFAKKEARKKKATTGYMGGRAKGGLASMKIKPATKRKRGLASKK